MPEEWTRDELMQRWRGFLAIHAEPQLGEVLHRYPETRSVYLRYYDLELHDEALAHKLLLRPQKLLSAGELALAALVQGDHRRPRGECRLHLRFRGLPRMPDVAVEIGDLRVRHLERLLTIPCVIKRVSIVRPLVQEAMFQCERCHAVIQEPQAGRQLREPVQCYEDQSGCGQPSTLTRFRPLPDLSRVINYQQIEVQQPTKRRTAGGPLYRLDAVLADDLAGQLEPRARVLLNGILLASPSGEGRGRGLELKYSINVLSIDSEGQAEEVLGVAQASARVQQ